MVWKSNSLSLVSEASKVARELRVFRTNEFTSRGFAREYLARLLESGEIERLSRGLYAYKTFDGDNNQTLLEVSKYFPRGVVCLAAALRFHDIGTQLPFEVWLAIPRNANMPLTTKAPVRFFKFSDKSYHYGIEKRTVEGGVISVYSPAKTVADCFKYRNKLGLDMAIEALQDGWKHHRFTMAELIEAAEVCRVSRVIRPYLDVLS